MKPSAIRVAKKWKNLPKGWTEDSVKKFWGGLTDRAPKHPVKRCMREMDGKVGNPGAFCGGLADEMIPGWRSKEASGRLDAELLAYLEDAGQEMTASEISGDLELRLDAVEEALSRLSHQGKVRPGSYGSWTPTGRRASSSKMGASVNRDAEKLVKDLRALRVNVEVGGGFGGGHILVSRPIRPRALSNQVTRLFQEASEKMGEEVETDRNGLRIFFRGTTTEILDQQNEVREALKDFFPKSQGQFYKEIAAAMKGKIPDHLVEEIRMGAQTDRLYEAWDQVREGIKDAPMELTEVPSGTWLGYFAEDIADGIVGAASWANNELNHAPGRAPPKVDLNNLYDKVVQGLAAARRANAQNPARAASARITLRFYECEHHGDMEMYIKDVMKSGAKGISRERVNEDEEECSMVVDVEDKAEFLRKFKTTEAYGFSNLADY